MDRFGKEKQLLEDIKNGNEFFVELVARNLDSYTLMLWAHTFIVVHSMDKNWNRKEYTIWWQRINGNLVGVFNHSRDKVILWWFNPAWFKQSIFFNTPEWMTSWEFVQNIYNEYIDYNGNHQVKFNLASKPFWNNDSGNCSNLATTILTRASNKDKDIAEQISNMDPWMFNWGLGEAINY